jgi:hypothetical protein
MKKIAVATPKSITSSVCNHAPGRLGTDTTSMRTTYAFIFAMLVSTTRRKT